MSTKGSLQETGQLLVKWKRERPIRRMLRSWSVVTALATSGLLLSIAALLIVIGVGQAQISAAATRSGDLFGNGWFEAGGVVAVIGTACGALGVAAVASQSKAMRDFPALEIEVIAGGFNPTTLPHGVRTASTWYSQLIGVRVTNRELTRSASLDVRLNCQLSPGFGTESQVRLRPHWQQEPYSLAGSMVQLRSPIALSPRETTEGFMVFDFHNVSPYVTDDRRLELVDNNSGRSRTIPTELGSFLDASR